MKCMRFHFFFLVLDILFHFYHTPSQSQFNVASLSSFKWSIFTKHSVHSFISLETHFASSCRVHHITSTSTIITVIIFSLSLSASYIVSSSLLHRSEQFVSHYRVSKRIIIAVRQRHAYTHTQAYTNKPEMPIMQIDKKLSKMMWMTVMAAF